MGKKKVTEKVKKSTLEKKDKKDQKKKFTIGYEISSRKRCWPTYYTERKWIHFKDNYNGKTFSFDINEIKMFMRYLPKLEKKLEKLEQEHLKDLTKTEESHESEASKAESCEEEISSSSDSE